MPSTSSGERSAGVLYVVGSPIGNLGDITLRAIETLKAVDRIAAEDTRHTRRLLSHLGIQGKPLDAIESYTSDARIERLLGQLEAGEDVALVTDAGMPSVSDPGARLVSAAVEAGFEVQCLPGPSAVTTAIALSGLVEGPFLFLGFLPRKGEDRAAFLERFGRTPEPVVLFESPNRTQATLADLAKWGPERAACVSREMTKLHEETARGTLAELAERAEWRGEVTIVVGPGVDDRPEVTDAELEQRIRAGLAEGRPVKGLSAELAAWSGRPRREVYALAQRLKG